MNIYIGTSGFAYREWIGTFYPAAIDQKKMLRFYAERFNTVEINNTFYRMPSPDVLLSWMKDVPAGFIFAFKAPRKITHGKDIDDTAVHYFFRVLGTLGPYLGPVLFQVPKYIKIHPGRIEKLLGLVPEDVPCAFEFRDAPEHDKEVDEMIEARGYSLCTCDSDERPAQIPAGRVPWGYLRLRRPSYTEGELASWSRTILSQKWDRAFAFVKHEGLPNGPDMAARLRELIASGTLPDGQIHG